MRAGSPALSAGRRGRRTSGAPTPRSRGICGHLPGFSRNKSPSAAVAEDPRVPVVLLQDMNLCYRLLRQLVPGLPPGRAASRVEILQHVIDYILDLQTELDASCPPRDPGEPQREKQHRQRPESGHSPGVRTRTCQSSDFTQKDPEVEEGWTLLR
ncbi:DNA-binding protein inhibitor ID-2b isoform X2 [Xiphias gladius]|uniref:DNA-binding protein inhibitor ID-2b isoform X2 n=1 Tax=Xiphias gladius TaxID=8245 RepID=UPI001A98A45F|nr:DNA-binding protein inhibitor ID-2b isoform X2 [Xiphias gladius]